MPLPHADPETDPSLLELLLFMLFILTVLPLYLLGRIVGHVHGLLRFITYDGYADGYNSTIGFLIGGREDYQRMRRWAYAKTGHTDEEKGDGKDVEK
jgi:hypothetical protein